MGKSTRYHPVSLQTIRGAAAQCGFRLGVIRQKAASFEEAHAMYSAQVLAWPAGWERKSQARQVAWFCRCFNIDVACTWAGQNSKGQFFVNFTTLLVPDADTSDQAADNFAESFVTPESEGI